MNWFRAFSLLPLLLLTLPAHAEGVLHRAIRVEPVTLDPGMVGTPSERAVVGDLFEGLLTLDAEGHPALGMADAWQQSPDGLRYTFHLRAGLTWSDGRPIDANAVAASFHRGLPGVMDVAAPDAATVQFTLAAPMAYFPTLLASPSAAIAPPDGDASVSNGPFMLKTWVRGERIALVRNPRFHDAANVALDEVIYYPTADIARYKTGEFDTFADFPPSQVDALVEVFGRQVHLDPALTTTYLAVNTSLKKFSDRRLRRALSMAIDRDVLTAKVLREGDIPATSFVPAATANYTPAEADFTHHPMDERIAAARNLLKDAGYDEEHPLRVTLAISNNQDYRRLAATIAAQWKRAGVDTVVQATEAKAHFANLRSGDFEIGLAAWLADFDDASNFLGSLQSASGSNFSRYGNTAFDALMAKAAATPDTAARAALLREAEALIMTDQPVVPLTFGVSKNLVAPRVVGWRGNPIDVHPSRYLSVEKPNG
jgi:oligopeptide transport system substrate-binding protein